MKITQIALTLPFAKESRAGVKVTTKVNARGECRSTFVYIHYDERKIVLWFVNKLLSVYVGIMRKEIEKNFFSVDQYKRDKLLTKRILTQLDVPFKEEHLDLTYKNLVEVEL